MEGERYCLHWSAVGMVFTPPSGQMRVVFMLASGQMRRKSRITERWSQSLIFEIGLDGEFWDVLTVLLKG